MANTFVEDKKIKAGEYSLTSYCGGIDNSGKTNLCLQFDVYNPEPECYLPQNRSYICFDPSEVDALIKELQAYQQRAHEILAR